MVQLRASQPPAIPWHRVAPRHPEGSVSQRLRCWSRQTPWAAALLVLTVSGVHAQSVADSAPPRGGTSAAQAPMGPTGSRPGSITVTGHVVRQDGVPIPHVSVSLFGTHDTTVTRDDGGFALHPSQPGVYMIGARGVGLREKRFAISLARGATQDVTVTMVPFVPMLPKVVTTAEERAAYASVGFDQRRRMGVGQFLTYEQILRRHASSFTQLLQGMRGIGLSQGPLQSHATGTGVTGTGGVGSCVSYVIDGSPQEQLTTRVEGTNTTESESPDNLIDVSQLGAVEVYSAAERPAGFGAMQSPPPPPPDNRGEESGNQGNQNASGQMMTPNSSGNQTYMPSQPCSLVMVWTRSHLSLPDPSAITTPNVSTQKTAPHDMTRGLPSFGRDASCTAQAATDTVDLLVYASVQGTAPRAMSDVDWAAYKDQVLAGLVRWSDLPSELLLPTLSRPAERGAARGIPAVDPRGAWDVAPTFSTVLVLTLDTAGALKDVQVAVSSLSGGADTSAIAMVEEAAAGHAFPRLPGSTIGSDSVPLYLIVESSEPIAGSQAAVLGQLEVPEWRLTRPAHLRSGLPKSEHRHGAPSDSVTVTLVVDSSGTVAKGTARFEVTDRTNVAPEGAYEARVLQALPALRFEPASIGSCHVNTVVTESFATADMGG